VGPCGRGRVPGTVDAVTERASAQRVVVIGAGVLGCSIAAELAHRGHEVVVVDAGGGAGLGSTSASAALIRFHYSTLDGVRLSWESRLIWERWGDHLAERYRAVDPTGTARFHRTGMLVLQPPGADLSGMLDRLATVGVPVEVLDAAEIARRWPALDVGRHFPPKRLDDDRFWDDPSGEVDGFWQPEAGFVDDPVLAAHNLLVAAEHCGATFRFHRRVVEVHREPGRVTGVTLHTGERLDAAVVVNVAGPHSSIVSGLAGVADDGRIRSRPLRQEVDVLPEFAAFRFDGGAPIVADADLGVWFRPHLGGTLLAGGMEPDCDPMHWQDDPDELDPHPSAEVWATQTTRLARRLPDLGVPNRPVGLAALYDVSSDWTPVYDRSSLDGWYQAVATSGNQFKNAPLVGILMADLIEACEAGHDHDADPVQVTGPITGCRLDLGSWSRQRELHVTSGGVMG
jgi:sarcosine oxidase, subunit beta